MDNDNEYKYWKYKFNPDYVDGIDLIAMVDNPATEVIGIQLSADEIKSIKIEYSVGSVEERILVAPLLIPDQQIYRDKINGKPGYVSADAETIKAVQEYYMKMGKQNNANYEHKGELIEGITFTQHWIIRNSEMDTINAYTDKRYPVGTWVTVAKLSQEAWDYYIKSGKVKGLSVEGVLGIEPVTMSNEKNNNKIKNLKMNKQTIEQIVLAAIKSVALASDLAEFKDAEGNSYFASELTEGSVVTNATGELITDSEFVIEDKKYSTDETGAIKSVEDVADEDTEEEPATDNTPDVIVEDAVEDAPVEDTPADEVVADEEPTDDKDAIIEELQKQVADLEAANLELEAKLVQAEDAKVEMSKQVPASSGLKDSPKPAKASGKESMTDMLKRLR